MIGMEIRENVKDLGECMAGPWGGGGGGNVMLSGATASSPAL